MRPDLPSDLRSKLTEFSQWFALIFSCLFILSIPFPYHFLPDWGSCFSSFSSHLNQFTGERFFGFGPASDFRISSDSTGMYIHLVHLTILTFIGTTIFISIPILKKYSQQIRYVIREMLRYFLALHMWMYGLNKVFKWQFYLPEPNILYSELGMIPKDLLYWTSMGISYEYTLFAGMLEVIAGLLLLFRKTRLIGALLSMGIMTNVVALNFAYDINVKVFSCFLLSIALILLAPHLKRILTVMLGGNPGHSNPETHSPGKGWRSYLLHASIVLLILVEAFGIYFQSGNFNDDLAERPPLHGAYTQIETSNTGLDSVYAFPWERIYFHRQGYFIIEYKNGLMEDHEVFLDTLEKKMMIGNEWLFSYSNDNKGLILEGRIEGKQYAMDFSEEDWRDLPALQPSFTWRTDEIIPEKSKPATASGK